jgi:hypothetical protein
MAMLRGSLILLVVLTLAAPAVAGGGDGGGGGGTINIMRPEPGTPAPSQKVKHSRGHKSPAEPETTEPKGYGVKQDSRRGSSNAVYPAPLPGPQAPVPVPGIETPARRATVPPPLYVPETGRALPNLPATGAWSGGAETTQDKSVRCAHQAGVYGPNATGNPAGYVGSCINQ